MGSIPTWGTDQKRTDPNELDRFSFTLWFEQRDKLDEFHLGMMIMIVITQNAIFSCLSVSK